MLVYPYMQKASSNCGTPKTLTVASKGLQMVGHQVLPQKVVWPLVSIMVHLQYSSCFCFVLLWRVIERSETVNFIISLRWFFVFSNQPNHLDFILKLKLTQLDLHFLTVNDVQLMGLNL